MLQTGASHGTGKHIESLSKDDLEIYDLGTFIFFLIDIIVIGLIKLSVLALYYRAFQSVILQRVSATTAVLITAWVIAMEIVWLSFLCRRLEAGSLRLPAACTKDITEGYLYFNGVSNLVLDLWVFVLPLPTIVKLRVPTKKKIALGCLFSIGAATCATTAARLVYSVFQGSYDITWDGVPLSICLVWEPVGAILCANLPTTYKPLAAWFRSITGQRSSDERHQTLERSPHSWYHRHMFARRRLFRHPLDLPTDECTRDITSTNTTTTGTTSSQGMSAADATTAT